MFTSFDYTTERIHLLVAKGISGEAIPGKALR